MAAKFNLMSNDLGETRYAFHCPGCEYGHEIPVAGPRKWEWNNSVEAPTLKPSILVNNNSANPRVPVCHSFVTDGKIQFLGDSTHKLAGKTVVIPDWDAEEVPLTMYEGEAMAKREVKNAVVKAKCSLDRDACKNPECPVHGEQKNDALKPSITGGDDTLEDVTQVLIDAKGIIEHLSHPNLFTQGLVERISKVLEARS